MQWGILRKMSFDRTWAPWKQPRRDRSHPQTIERLHAPKAAVGPKAVYRGEINSGVKGSVGVLFLKLHHRVERGREGRECKFENKSDRTFDIRKNFHPCRMGSRRSNRTKFPQDDIVIGIFERFRTTKGEIDNVVITASGR